MSDGTKKTQFVNPEENAGYQRLLTYYLAALNDYLRSDTANTGIFKSAIDRLKPLKSHERLTIGDCLLMDKIYRDMEDSGSPLGLQYGADLDSGKI